MNNTLPELKKRLSTFSDAFLYRVECPIHNSVISLIMKKLSMSHDSMFLDLIILNCGFTRKVNCEFLQTKTMVVRI